MRRSRQRWHHDRFVQRYCDTDAGDYDEPKVIGLRGDRAGEFYAGMAGAWRRVTKADALPFLPPKVTGHPCPE